MSRFIRHLKRGSVYEVVGDAEIQVSLLPQFWSGPSKERIAREGDLIRVYRGEDGKLWARFPDEFEGRFEDV